MNVPSLTPGEKLAIGGSLLATLGAILPWVSTSRITLPGYVLDGFTVLTFTIPVLGIIALWEWGRIQKAVVSLLGLFVVLIAANHVFRYGTEFTGLGAYLTFIAGMLIVGAGAYGLFAEGPSPTGDVDEPAG